MSKYTGQGKKRIIKSLSNEDIESLEQVQVMLSAAWPN